MEIIQHILTKNECYRPGRVFRPSGIMLHSVGCPQPSADVFVKNWNRPGVKKCVHAFIDANNGNVYQTLPWNMPGWHAGGSANQTHIGVEMCEPSQIKYKGGARFDIVGDPDNAREAAVRAYKAAVSLFAMLCHIYTLDPLKSILSHSEGATKGIASGHADPVHLWAQLSIPYTMDGFRQEVFETMKRYNTIADLPEYAKPYIRALCDKGAIGGTSKEKDTDGYPAKMDLSDDMVRCLIIGYRAVFGNA